mgnify:CR=1 FL=1
MPITRDAGIEAGLAREKRNNEAMAAGFPTIQAQQQNRTLRNTIDQRSASSGVTWKQSEEAYKAKFGSAPRLTNDQALQWLYDYMGSSEASAANTVAEQTQPTTTGPQIKNTYQDKISDLEDDLASASNSASEPTYNYYKNFVGGGNTGPAGIGSIDRAYAGTLTDGTTMPGRTYQQILDASRKQGFTFETGSYDYLMDKLNQERQDQSKTNYANDLKTITDSFEQKFRDQESKNAEQLNQLTISQNTFQRNQSRAGMSAALQIGGASQTPRSGGTQGFKRRQLQINPATSNALLGILGGTNATKSTNTLNV